MHCHHHCPSSSNSISPAVLAYAASSSASRSNDNTEESCNVWCSFCGFLRYALVFLGLLAFALDYILRINLGVAIVAMVNNTVSHDVNSSYACPAALNASREAQSTTGAGEYNWSQKEQGLVLGTLFWGFLITKTIGGRIAERLGPTFTVTSTMTLCAVLTMLTPTVADVHPLALAALRLLLGLLQGPITPAVYSILSRWAPPGERATMISIAFSGPFLGTLVSLGLSGLVIESFGWRWVFWGSGILTLAWLPLWIIHVRDNPRNHPGISRRERQLLSKIQNHPRRKVPWSRIFTSRHIYLFIMMEFGNMWLQGLLVTEGPTYLTNQVGMNLKTVSVVNIVVMGIGQVLSFVYGWLSDLLERRELLTGITIRRLFQVFGTLLVMLSLLGLSVAGCDGMLVAGLLVLLAIGGPVNYVTYIVVPMIIAPNYAGTISGLLGLGDIGGFLFPLFVSFFVEKKNGWMVIFLVCASIYVVSGIIYTIWMPAGEVEWNSYEEIPGTDTDATQKRKKGGRKAATP